MNRVHADNWFGIGAHESESRAHISGRQTPGLTRGSPLKFVI
jgi:hypothetical protein